jgi:hypothetical protein
MAPIKQIPKRATTILTMPNPGTAPSKTTGHSVGSVDDFGAKELHPLPPIHLNPDENLSPKDLQKQILDIYESVRRATMGMRQNPESAPAYVRNVQFAAPASPNANVTSVPVTVTFRHGLGRAPANGVTCIHSEGAPFQGIYVPPVGPEDYDPTQYARVTTNVPPGTTATHHFKLSSE